MLKNSMLPFQWSSHKWFLFSANIIIGIFFIIFSQSRLFPIDLTNFLFFSFLGLLFSLYRPGWAFLLLIGMLPYEIINIAPQEIPLAIRPYQWLLVLITFSLGARYALRRFPLEKFSLRWFDISLVVFACMSFLSAFQSDNKILALKLSTILVSFLFLYFVTRLFVRSIEDVKMILPFLLSSFIVVSCFALIQNIFFLNGKESYEVMAGRPNSVFPEADWLGFYIAFMIVLLSSFGVFLKERRDILLKIIFVSLVFGYGILLITVSRSAWLATASGMIVLVGMTFIQKNIWQALKEKNTEILRAFASLLAILFMPFFIALISVSLFHLSPFNLLDRTSSTVTGEQQITLSCEKNVSASLPDKIQSIDELATFHCRHILLEEIDTEKQTGRWVTTVYRDDPNVHIRRDIYTKVVALLKTHSLFGIGFGNISSFLGTDERGTGLNASNIFLEIWLGSGIVGLCAFLFFWIGIAYRTFVRALWMQSERDMFLFSLWVTVTVFNLFNSGLFLSLFFVFLASLALTFDEYE